MLTIDFRPLTSLGTWKVLHLPRVALQLSSGRCSTREKSFKDVNHKRKRSKCEMMSGIVAVHCGFGIIIRPCFVAAFW